MRLRTTDGDLIRVKRVIPVHEGMTTPGIFGVDFIAIAVVPEERGGCCMYPVTWGKDYPEIVVKVAP